MRKSIVLAAGGWLAIAGLTILAGCGSQDKSAGIPVGPKWKGLPYRLTFDAKATNPKGIVIPPVKFTANPDELVTRAVLIVRFDVPGTPTKGQMMNHMISPPFDIQGAEGAVPAGEMDRASKGLSDYLGGYCADGKVPIEVALGRSSINPQAADSDLDTKRLSDWLPSEVVLKKTGGKCKGK